jgi:hypothetical protein
MTWLRQRITVIGMTCLLFQAAAFAMSPFVSCCATPSQAAVNDDDACCKGMAPGQMCPLHKHRQAAKDTAHHDEAPARCAMRSGCAPVDPALISFGFGLGVLPPAVSLDVIQVSIPVPAGPFAAVHRARSLDPPPPRA